MLEFTLTQNSTVHTIKRGTTVLGVIENTLSGKTFKSDALRPAITLSEMTEITTFMTDLPVIT